MITNILLLYLYMVIISFKEWWTTKLAVKFNSLLFKLNLQPI